VDRLTRKELKQDKFAQEVGQTVEFLERHRRQILRYSAIAAALVLVAAGWLYYSRYQKSVRQKELAAAMDLMQAPIGPPELYGPNAFPTPEDKDKAVEKALQDLVSKHPRSEEAFIALYFLGARAGSNPSRLEEAVKYLQQAGGGNSPYASLARLALAEVYASQGKIADAEKLLRGLMEKPTILVSKEQATLALARLLAASRPQEARKLLEPLRSSPGPVGRVATETLEEMEAAAAGAST
jgi:predicted negative regulator of RcsB-dependent stress response